MASAERGDMYLKISGACGLVGSIQEPMVRERVVRTTVKKLTSRPNSLCFSLIKRVPPGRLLRGTWDAGRGTSRIYNSATSLSLRAKPILSF